MRYLFAAFLLMTLMSSAWSKQIYIIHINDLHSYFRGYFDGKAGYAKVKVKIDELKADAIKKGFEPLILDGGDFGEGTSFFLSDNGADTIRALELFGVEASVIGNHDHLLGGSVLAKQIKKANVTTKMLSANIVASPQMGLDGLMFPYADFVKNGLKIRVVGLSTNEPHFQYMLFPENGHIDDATEVGNQYADAARADGKDLVIALTHIGVSKDKVLAKSSKNIGVIVGAHSHTKLEKAVMVKNLNGKDVPIVQAWAHGLTVGHLIVDVKEDGSTDLIEYELHDIIAGMPEDPSILNFVEKAEANRNLIFGGRWDESLGTSEIPLTGAIDGHAQITKSCWGRHMARISKEATGADIGVHLAFFEGMEIQPGPIKFGDMVDNFPHVRNFGDPGWEISTFKMKGQLLVPFFKALLALKTQVGFNFDGIKYSFVRIPDEIPKWGGITYAWKFRINGELVEKDKEYVVAFPTEVAYSLKAMVNDEVRKIFPDWKTSGKFYWPEMEKYVRAHSPLRCLRPNE